MVSGRRDNATALAPLSCSSAAAGAAEAVGQRRQRQTHHLCLGFESVKRH